MRKENGIGRRKILQGVATSSTVGTFAFTGIGSAKGDKEDEVEISADALSKDLRKEASSQKGLTIVKKDEEYVLKISRELYEKSKKDREKHQNMIDQSKENAEEKFTQSIDTEATQ